MYPGNIIFELGRDIDPTIPSLRANHIKDLENGELMALKKVLQINDHLPEASLMAVAEAMHKYPDLRLTFYSHADVTRIDWSVFSHVRHLSIGGKGNWEHINFLEQMPLLESLELIAPLKCKASLLPIENLRQLKRLSLNGIQKDVDKIVWLNGLDSLGLCVGKLKDLAFMANIPFIKNLSISYTQASDYKVLLNTKGLKILNLLGLRGFQEEDAYSLQQIPELKLLTMSRCSKIKSIEFVAGLQQLKKLRLGSMSIYSYDPLYEHETLQVISTHSIEPANKSLKGVYHIPHVYLGGRFPKQEIEAFLAGFTGKDAIIGGVQLKGAMEEYNFIYHVNEVTDV